MVRVLLILLFISITTACATFFHKQNRNQMLDVKRFPTSESTSFETQLVSIDKNKPTVCTITINSHDERQIFQSFLKDDFNFIELTSGDSDWFQNACEKKIKCDVLVVSGHFGGSFFGSSNYRLSLNTLQRASCQTACDGILKHPKEVFLFGCNTTAGKKADHRTPEEYTQVLIADGFSRGEAEQVSAFRYSPIGQETQNKMKQVFQNSRIYGYYSQAPSGKNIRHRLNQYFNSIPKLDYKSHLKQFPTESENLLWSQAMKGQWIRSINGTKNIENPVCILEDKKVLIYKKLEWINSILMDKQKSLAYVPIINDYMKDLEKKYGKSWHGLSKAELSFLERIQLNKKAKKRVSSILEKPLPGMLSVQIQALNFMKRIGWYNKQEYSVKLKNLIGDLFKENLDNEQKDAFCSLQVQIDLSLENLPKEKWNRYTLSAIGCSKTSNIQVHLALAEALKDPDEDVRRSASWALKDIKPTDPQIHLALAEALKDPYKYVRRSASWALGKIKPTDPQIHLPPVFG